MDENRKLFKYVICEKCKKVINDLFVEEILTGAIPNSMLMVKQYDFHPNVCPHCGNTFNAIVVHDSGYTSVM